MEVKSQDLLENIPTEMLVAIFSYLSESDITHSIIYVCKRWLSAAKTLPCMTQKGLTFVTRPPPSDTLDLIQNTDYRIISINLNDPIFELFPIELWRELGKTVKTIRFNRCTDLNEQHLISILQYFPLLKCLNFRFRFPSLSHNFSMIDASPLAIKHLKSITQLNLNSNIWMDMSKVEQLVTRMSQLEHFGLWCLGITPVNDIMKVIRRQAKTIRSLSLRHCRTNNGTMLMEHLTNLDGLSLEKLTFSISWIAEGVVRDFFVKQNKIKVLQIGTSVAFPNKIFDYLLNLEELKELSIEIVEYLHTYHVLKRFFELPALQNLSIERETDAEHTKCIGMHDETLKAKKLKHLRLTYFNIECCLCIDHFYKSLSNLQSLSISSSNITDTHLSLIFEHMQHLRSLDLSRCTKITDAGMVEQLNTAVKRQKTNKFYLNSLKGLTYLNLNGCVGLTDTTFLQSYEMRDLKTLNIGCIPKLTALGLTKISSNFPTLESLQIHGNENVKAPILETLLQNLTRLRELDISKYSSKDLCQPLTTEDIDAIYRNSKKLKTLIILQRKLLTTQIVFLFQNIPTLVSVNDVTRTRLKAGGELDRKIMRDVPKTGEIAVVEDSFLKVLEQVRDKNTEFIKEPINLGSFLI